MKKTIFFLINFSIFCTACLQKGGFGYVEGNIYKQGTNEPIENVKISIIRTHNANQGQYIKTTTSDENGYYKIPYYYKFNSDYRYYVTIKPENTYESQSKYMINIKEKFDFYFP